MVISKAVLLHPGWERFARSDNLGSDYDPRPPAGTRNTQHRRSDMFDRTPCVRFRAYVYSQILDGNT